MDLLTSPETEKFKRRKTNNSLAITTPTAEKATTHKGGNPRARHLAAPRERGQAIRHNEEPSTSARRRDY